LRLLKSGKGTALFRFFCFQAISWLVNFSDQGRDCKRPTEHWNLKQGMVAEEEQGKKDGFSSIWVCFFSLDPCCLRIYFVIIIR